MWILLFQPKYEQYKMYKLTPEEIKFNFDLENKWIPLQFWLQYL